MSSPRPISSTHRPSGAYLISAERRYHSPSPSRSSYTSSRESSSPRNSGTFELAHRPRHPSPAPRRQDSPPSARRRYESPARVNELSSSSRHSSRRYNSPPPPATGKRRPREYSSPPRHHNDTYTSSRFARHHDSPPRPAYLSPQTAARRSRADSDPQRSGRSRSPRSSEALHGSGARVARKSRSQAIPRSEPRGDEGDERRVRFDNMATVRTYYP